MDRIAALNIRTRAGGVLVEAKIVPNASRNRIAGVLGDRLKIAVSTPPEKGKANQAVCQVLAEVLGIDRRGVRVVAGEGRPRKTLAIEGLTPADLRAKLRDI
jgi:hypothetical protein